MNVLSVFNGMGCIWIALDRLGVKVNKRYSSEIDKYANLVNDNNYPDTIQLGDIQKVKASKLDKIDLFVGGSPCQGFSFAGKQLNFNDPRSALFFEYVRLLREIQENNPQVKFLLENVNMKREHMRIISDYLGVFPVNINSNLVSAQNRNRWYWTNIKTKEVGLFNELHSDIPQPEDKGILLKDILQPENEVDEKYYMNPETIKGLMNNSRFMPHCEFEKKSYTVLTHPQRSNSNFIKIDKKGNKKLDQNKASCITGGGNSGGNYSDMDIICVAMRGRNSENPKDHLTEQRLEPKTDGKTNCITSVSKDNLILQVNTSKESGGKQPYQQNRVYNTNGKMACLSAEIAGRNNITDGYTLRRLTPIECERLQTVPDNYTDCVSDTQRYKMLGNGWTGDVIVHILRYIDMNNSFIFTPENLIDNIEKVGPWSIYGLASEALQHYFPDEYVEGSPSTAREAELLCKLGFKSWDAVVIKYQNEIGYKAPNGFSCKLVNEN